MVGRPTFGYEDFGCMVDLFDRLCPHSCHDSGKQIRNVRKVLLITHATFLTLQVASNTATANVLLPILADISLTICQNPLYLIMPSAVISSYAFMLPVATAPNAIVFGASTLTTGYMMKAGLGMNIICLIGTIIAINTYAVPLFDLNTFPTWAEPQLPINVTCTT